MQDINDWLVSELGFSIKGKDRHRTVFNKQDLELELSSGWTGRYEEHLCFKLSRDGQELLNTSYQIDTEGYMSKPKLYTAEEIKKDLQSKLHRIFNSS